MPFLGTLSLILGAVGAGVSYVSARSAAKTQETLAMLNAQAQTQAIEQQGQINQMQSAINTRLAEKDAAAAEENVRTAATQAEMNTRAGIESIRRSREQVAAEASEKISTLGKMGFAATGGGILDYLSRAAQQHAQTMLDAVEQERRVAFRDISISRNQTVLAGLNVTSQRLSGLAAAQQRDTQLAQTRMDLMAQRAAASAARTQAGGSLLNSLGGLAARGYSLKYSAPGGGGIFG